MAGLQRYGFVSDCAGDALIYHLRHNSTHFVIIGANGSTTSGLADSERMGGYGWQDLARSISRMHTLLYPHRLVEETPPSVEGWRKRVYTHNNQAGGSVVVFDEPSNREDSLVVAGVLLAHEHIGILADMLRTYRLPFPAGMRRT